MGDIRSIESRSRRYALHASLDEGFPLLIVWQFHEVFRLTIFLIHFVFAFTACETCQR
jgi:hypothetical protein